MVSIHQPLGYEPSISHCATLLLMHVTTKSVVSIHGLVKSFEKIVVSRGWFRSIDLWVMSPARSHCATLLLMHVTTKSVVSIHGLVKSFEKIVVSRGWFRSIDLWVMSPARSHCATLLVTVLLLLASTLACQNCSTDA